MAYNYLMPFDHWPLQILFNILLQQGGEIKERSRMKYSPGISNSITSLLWVTLPEGAAANDGDGHSGICTLPRTPKHTHLPYQCFSCHSPCHDHGPNPPSHLVEFFVYPLNLLHLFHCHFYYPFPFSIIVALHAPALG